MVFVDTVHCPDGPNAKVGLRCTDSERNNPNHLTICNAFAPGQTCRVPKRRQQFCIDRYEYPNDEGGHPPVMVSAYDAAGLCAERGKRMCFESEWTAACEGPKKLPFPYGHERSSEHCNIDNRYVHPHLSKVHSHDDAVRGPELLRLDQSVPSGSLDTCQSGFGVYDLTGNFDEWVMTEWRRGKSKWAGLKGGAWGHVRNACRPITTSHVAHWSYYFISFRCCADPDPAALAKAEPPEGAADVPLWKHPDAAAPPHPAGRPLDRGWTPEEGAVAPNAPKR
jgi:formylglycine-generating enzyme required for sulfatase activity